MPVLECCEPVRPGEGANVLCLHLTTLLPDERAPEVVICRAHGPRWLIADRHGARPLNPHTDVPLRDRRWHLRESSSRVDQIWGPTTQAKSANVTSSMLASPGDGRVVLTPQKLKALRLSRGLSQEALAEYCAEQRLCVSIASIKRAETGKCILYRTARHLAEAYQVPMESLVSRETASARAHEDKAETRSSAADAPSEADRLPAALDEEAATRTIILVTMLHGEGLALASQQDTERLLAQLGGVLLAPEHCLGQWVAVFGLPAAYRSHIARCVHCSNRMAEQLGPAAAR